AHSGGILGADSGFESLGGHRRSEAVDLYRRRRCPSSRCDHKRSRWRRPRAGATAPCGLDRPDCRRRSGPGRPAARDCAHLCPQIGRGTRARATPRRSVIKMDDGFEYSIARLTEDDDLDEVVALEAMSFSNPWSRDILARELRNRDVVRVYVLRDAKQQML